MQGIQGLCILLLLQAAGELLARLLHLPLPGPIVGMVLLLGALSWERLRASVQVCAQFLLSHLSLLFIPISVGVVGQLPLLQQYAGRIALALLASTLLGLAVTALVLRALLKEDAP